MTDTISDDSTGSAPLQPAPPPDSSPATANPAAGPVIDEHQIRHLATLARLALDGGEQARLQHDLARILALVNQLGSVDTAGVAPLAHPLDAVQRLRADAVTEADARSELLAAAPDARDGFIVVPRVVE